ncbi:MAG: glutamyl-tRNA reductase [Methylococcales bacterium]|jgi:glutamyl-tRNA reductase|nr:glutamyl-tRNA reductase [Methylococcales bacterium]
MTLFAIGLNHKTAPVDIREKVSFPTDSLPDALQSLHLSHSSLEAAILSTCNRTEIYCGAPQIDLEHILSWPGKYLNIPQDTIRPYLYLHQGADAVRHMLRVASGLDSMVLGEPQVLGQMKTAYQSADHAGTLGKHLRKLFQHTFSVAKQVRTDTSIGESPVSVAYAAVNLAKQIFGELTESRALLIGAGETIELAARHLQQQGIQHIMIANRTVEKARNLADSIEVKAEAMALSEIPAYLHQADIVISSTGSQLPILGKGTVESALKQRKYQPMFLVDIAVPRDIEHEVSQLDDAYLYTVDDLHSVIQDNLKSRQEAAQQAEDIIEPKVFQFMEWIESLSAIDVIRQVRQHGEKHRDDAVQKALKSLTNGKAADEVIQQLAHSLTNKFLHTPSVQLQHSSKQGSDELLKAAIQLFDLDQ